ncbi:MAG: acyl-CoA/acyl-ACP dehydrogenase [Cryobacterium sp.]|nr:acyl-CoA/acyl-ACP dehydrogenase [Cryobacterium sp.]
MDDDIIESLIAAVGEVLDTELAGLASDRAARNRTTLNRVLTSLGELGYLTAGSEDGSGLGLYADARLAATLAESWGSLAWAALPTLLGNRLGEAEGYAPTALAFPEPNTWSQAQLEGGTVTGELRFVLNADSATRVLAVSPSGAAVMASIAKRRESGDSVEGFSETIHDSVFLAPDGAAVTGELVSAVRILRASIACGLAAGAISLGVRYAQERVQFGHPIGVYGEIRSIVARAAGLHRSAQALVDQVARAWDAGSRSDADAAQALLVAVENSTIAIERMQHVHGGYGQMAEFEIGRYMRDVRIVGAFDASLPSLEDIVADDFGLPRFSS